MKSHPMQCRGRVARSGCYLAEAAPLGGDLTSPSSPWERVAPKCQKKDQSDDGPIIGHDGGAVITRAMDGSDRQLCAATSVTTVRSKLFPTVMNLVSERNPLGSSVTWGCLISPKVDTGQARCELLCADDSPSRGVEATNMGKRPFRFLPASNSVIREEVSAPTGAQRSGPTAAHIHGDGRSDAVA
jgi:hypothetical protein